MIYLNIELILVHEIKFGDLIFYRQQTDRKKVSVIYKLSWDSFQKKKKEKKRKNKADITADKMTYSQVILKALLYPRSLKLSHDKPTQGLDE